MDQTAFDLEPFSTDDDELPEAVAPPDAPKFKIPRGKYAGLILPRMLGVKQTYLDKVLSLRDHIVNDPDFKPQATVLAATYADLRREADEKIAELSEIKLRLAAVQLLMTDRLEVEDVAGVTLVGGDKIRSEYAPHLIIQDPEQFRLWCIEQRLERQMVLPWGTANKLLKERLEQGLDEPPGGSLFVRTKVVFTKGK